MAPLFINFPKLSASECGQGAIEALVVLPVLLLTATLMIQVALIGMGKIMLQYSAFSAARTGEVNDFNLDEMTKTAERILASVPGTLSSGTAVCKVTIATVKSDDEREHGPGDVKRVLPIQVRVAWDFPLIVPLAGKILQKNPLKRSVTGYRKIKLTASWNIFRETHAAAAHRI